MVEVHGKLFDGESSKLSSAILQLNDAGQLYLRNANHDQMLDANEVEISSRLGNSARYVELGVLGRFETTDNDAIDAMARELHVDDKSNFLHKLESNLPLIAVAVVITALFIAATVRWGIPIAADKIVDALPEKSADIIESKILEQLESSWFEPSKLSKARSNQLQDLFEQVLTKLNAQDKGYEFKLRDAQDSIGANALAFPSGTIIMTDQMVELASNDVQLAGILAHEVGHLEGKHSLRQLVRASIVTIAVAFIAGDASGASSALIAAPVAILQLSYSREFESDADSYALRYLGCDKEALALMADFFQIFAKLEQLTPSASDKNDQEKTSAIDLETSDLDNQKIENQHIEKGSNESVFENFLATHPASSKRSEVFSNHYKNECQ